MKSTIAIAGLVSVFGVAALSAQGADRETLGNVVAVRKTFAVSLQECQKTFKRSSYQSSCTVVSDTSKKSKLEVEVAGGTQPIVISEDLPGRDSHFHVTFTPSNVGYSFTFEKSTGGSSRGLSFDEATPYIQAIVAQLGGKSESYVFSLE